jgi:F-type H+-transporting ATPase subunit epsilon
MMKTMQLEIVSMETALFSGAIEMMTIMGNYGELGIYPGHRQLLTTLKPGQLKAILPGGKEEIFYISGGILEVQPQIVTILADSALRAADLDEAAVFSAKEEAERVLAKKKAGLEYSKAIAELAEASAQLRAIQMLRHNHPRH